MTNERKPSGVYVRARVDDNRWDSTDALDLDDESFRRFILDVLARQGLVISLERPEAHYRARPGIKRRGGT